jgi:hypothetical protein
VCKLNKTLYDLRQSPRACFDKLSNVVMEFNTLRCQIDHSVFRFHTHAGCILLVVYVDDIVITKDYSRGIVGLKQFLTRNFRPNALENFSISWALKLLDLKKGLKKLMKDDRVVLRS